MVGRRCLELNFPEFQSSTGYLGANKEQSGFYTAFGTPYDGKPMHSMFSTRDTAQHKSLKQAVANKFSLSALRDFESQIDSCSNRFVSVMHEFAATNKVVDLGAWLQWYAFDVIGAITFSRTFGFMDERKDVQDIIAGIEMGLYCNSIVGQIPELHTWLLSLLNLLSVVKAVDNANPVPKIVKVDTQCLRHPEMWLTNSIDGRGCNL